MKKPIFTYPPVIDTINHPLALIFIDKLVEKTRATIADVEVALLTQMIDDADEQFLELELDVLVYAKKELIARSKEHMYLYN